MLVRIGTFVSLSLGARDISGTSTEIHLSARRLDRLICEGDCDRDAILRAQVSGDVTLPRRIFDQIDVAWTNCDLLTSCNLDLSSTAELELEGVYAQPP